MEGNIKQIQTAIFVPDFRIHSDAEKSEVFLNLINTIGDIFDKEPTMIPIPNEAPAEIPRFIFAKTDGTASCNVSRNRFDIFTHVLKPESIDVLFKAHEDLSLKVFNFINDSNVPTAIGRVGFVVHMDYEVDGDTSSADYIRRYFFKEEAATALKEMLVRMNVEGKVSGTELLLNRITEISGNRKKKIHVQFDINTLPEELEKAELNSQFEIILKEAMKCVKDERKSLLD